MSAAELLNPEQASLVTRLISRVRPPLVAVEALPPEERSILPEVADLVLVETSEIQQEISYQIRGPQEIAKERRDYLVHLLMEDPVSPLEHPYRYAHHAWDVAGARALAARAYGVVERVQLTAADASASQPERKPDSPLPERPVRPPRNTMAEHRIARLVKHELRPVMDKITAHLQPKYTRASSV